MRRRTERTGRPRTWTAPGGPLPDALPGLDPGREDRSLPPPPAESAPALCERFYRDAVRPVLERRFPELPHAAALLDHGAGALAVMVSGAPEPAPRVTLFLAEDASPDHADRILQAMERELPDEHREPADTGESAPPAGVRVTTASAFATDYLGVDATRPIPEEAWLLVPSHRLYTVRSGRIFHDGSGLLAGLRERLHWYPPDVWLYRMAAQWRRIALEQACAGRCGQAGDDLGARVAAARLVRELMRLALLLERRYPPSARWLGSAFAELECAPTLGPVLHAALDADRRLDRERRLGAAVDRLARMHERLGVTGSGAPRDGEAGAASSGSADGLAAARTRASRAVAIADALRRSIRSDALRTLPPLGSVDQWVDSVEVLDDPERARRLQAIYAGAGAARSEVRVG